MVQVTAKGEALMQDIQRREDASARHERLVAYVHALSDTHEVRTGVWMEHSYARARGSLPADSAPRVLLGARAPPAPAPAPEEPLDVERLDPPAPSPPAPLSPWPSPSPTPSPSDSSDMDSDGDGDEEGWEARVATLAPTATHARLVGRVLDVLRAQRLARVAAGGCSTSRREAARTAARRLRSALAPHWAGAARIPQWLHATLSAHLPRWLKCQYEEAIVELARAVPRLAERLGAVRAPRVASPVRLPEAEAEAGGPWLAWVGEGRWQPRLAALVPTRVLRVPESATGPPAGWCAAVAGAVRARLAEVVAEAGERGVAVGGAGAGAALGAWLAAGARVLGLVLVAPALETPEGARDSPEDALREVRVPTLVVCGGGGGSRARALCARAGRRLLEVRGVDAALRVPRGLRRRARLTQEALDAAVAEECARWVQEVAGGDAVGAGAGAGAGAGDGEGGRLRRTAPFDCHQRIVHANGAGAAARDEEEFAHLVASAPAVSNTRSIEIAEGRVVTRVSGGTPLALAPPRRSPCGAGGGAGGAGGGAGGGVGGGTRLAPADIMQMPIVFADDAHAEAREAPHGKERAPAAAESAGGGAAPYSRVIVAKRGARAGGAGGGVRARGVLLRRASRREW